MFSQQDLSAYLDEALSPVDMARVEARINATVSKEAAVRKALMHTYLYLNKYARAIEEASTILRLDPSNYEVYLWRGNAYAFLDPPNYRAAVTDLKTYRHVLTGKEGSGLTDELVQINRRILRYEKKAKQKPSKRRS